ncbi:ead/Ea22-like family protein [Pseudomonas caricapapayae]|uniref:Ead/Ea22-like family protein n=1 Tax=Pseudomonas caricapapayae TaxID=46678 RepID=A0ACC7LR02_9PSED
MTIDKQKLKALAEAATHGERKLWDAENISPQGIDAIPVAIPSQMVVLCHVFGSFNPMMDSYVGAASYRKDADFIAAAGPDTVLALLAEIESLSGCDKAYAEVWEKARDLQGEIDDVVAKRDQLKAENEALRKDADGWKSVLHAMEQLKSDEQGAAIWSACARILISLASDMNSARSIVTEEGVTSGGVEIGDWRVTVERLAMAKEASHD